MRAEDTEAYIYKSPETCKWSKERVDFLQNWGIPGASPVTDEKTEVLKQWVILLESHTIIKQQSDGLDWSLQKNIVRGRSEPFY